MKNPNELRKLIFFNINECEAIRELLEDMALKGWKLKRVQTFLYFEKIEPKPLRHAVKISPKASIYDTRPVELTNRYIDECNEAGWEFICNSGQISFFVSDSETIAPIETNDALKLKSIIKGTLKQSGFIWFGLFPLFMLNAFLNFLNFERLVTSEISLLGFLLYIIFIIISLFQAIGFLVWVVKQKIRLRNSDKLKAVSQKTLKLKMKIYMSIPAIIALIILAVAVKLVFNHNYFGLATMLFMVLIIAIIFMFAHFWQKKGYSTTANKVIPIFFGIGISFLTIIFVLMSISLFDTETALEDRVLSSAGTFLAQTTTYDYGFEEGEPVTFTIFESKYPFILNQYIYSETHIFFIKDKSYEEVSQPEWNAKSVVISQDNTYISYDNCVISISSRTPLSEEEIAEMKAFIGK